MSSNNERQQEEIDVLESMYGNALSRAPDDSFVLKLPEFSLKYSYPAGYPSTCPPVLLQLSLGPSSSSSSLLQEAEAEKIRLWEVAKSEVVMFELISWVNEAIQRRGTTEEEGRFSLTRDELKLFEQSLQKEGFKQYGCSWVHEKQQATCDIETCETVSSSLPESPSFFVNVAADGGERDEINQFLALSIRGSGRSEFLQNFGKEFVEWLKAQANTSTPGFTEETDDDDEKLELARYLPTSSELGVDPTRPLRILTWGNKTMKWSAVQSRGAQRNFNAAVLNGRGGGVDIRNNNGLSDGVQRNVSRCPRFPAWLQMFVDSAEKENLHVVGVNCAKGRHRSVAAAELLKKLYYPLATIEHLTIY
mmetsp:Transcript_4141/g.6421  ORF Transcript_4141/g.6421 Transcript_4141/m.6421 type:complete len:363 (-) Transcript_4141:116-1204(-)|eukprot:CAMPEP_0175115872 /NCGR_PEP_ID=MMETSP0086_2-20121207/17856_1 /TAXON_ID=136419 /ORGANISM="Unknown Unknown, Strain D1" /LENGTH=362 /DNA_ID=CAMNT_0016396087 /DNA_START=139 /DNA_END=1227 /DNA_ORIENTATION=-